MSIIGTRPTLISETNLYELHHRARLAIKPGGGFLVFYVQPEKQAEVREAMKELMYIRRSRKTR